MTSYAETTFSVCQSIRRATGLFIVMTEVTKWIAAEMGREWLSRNHQVRRPYGKVCNDNDDDHHKIDEDIIIGYTNIILSQNFDLFVLLLIISKSRPSVWRI